jgi:hypothetical protein
VERIEKSDRIVMVGTPLYREKYENKVAGAGFVVAAEVDVISHRLLGSEAEKQSVCRCFWKAIRPVRYRRCCTGECMPIFAKRLGTLLLRFG